MGSIYRKINSNIVEHHAQSSQVGPRTLRVGNVGQVAAAVMHDKHMELACIVHMHLVAGAQIASSPSSGQSASRECLCMHKERR